MESKGLFELWKKWNSAPYALPMTQEVWEQSMYEDADSDGRTLFDELITDSCEDGIIQYGRTAFGFDGSGEISDTVHYNVIRQLFFVSEASGKKLLDTALAYFPKNEKVYAFFHYFGMSACGRHGKLHESAAHIEKLLLTNGFTVEHENLYYSRALTEQDTPSSKVTLHWKKLSPGGCREFAAVSGGGEVGWGQVHFLPQGDTAYLRWIYIDQSRQHQGFGTAVMRNLFAALYQQGIRRFDTDTALDNKHAQAYYEKTGFTNRGITRSYYTA